MNISFLSELQKVLDLVGQGARSSKRLKDLQLIGSIGRTDFPGGDHDTLISSITQRLWPMGDDTVFIPGHGPESSFGTERRTNPYVRGT